LRSPPKILFRGERDTRVRRYLLGIPTQGPRRRTGSMGFIMANDPNQKPDKDPNGSANRWMKSPAA